MKELTELEVAKKLSNEFSWYNRILDIYSNLNLYKIINYMSVISRKKKEKELNYKLSYKLEKQLHNRKKK